MVVPQTQTVPQRRSLLVCDTTKGERRCGMDTSVYIIRGEAPKLRTPPPYSIA